MKASIAKYKDDERWLNRTFNEGEKLTENIARKLDRAVSKNPLCLESQIRLLGFYCSCSHDSKSAGEASLKHATWVIANIPDYNPWFIGLGRLARTVSAKQFAYLRDRWFEQLEKHPRNVLAHVNAGRFLGSKDPESAIKLLKRACDLEPANCLWHVLLTEEIFEQFRKSPKSRKKLYAHKIINAATQGLKEIDNANDFVPGFVVFLLKATAHCALFLNDLDLARICAAQLQELASITKFPWLGQLSSTLLGFVAIKNDDLDSARKHLLTIKNGYKWQSDTVELVRQLLKKGQKKAVIQFIKKSYEAGLITKTKRINWLLEINSGKIPDFGEEKTGCSAIGRNVNLQLLAIATTGATIMRI